MKIKEVMTAKEYDQRQTRKWHNDCHNWKPNKYGTADGYPQLVFYIFGKNYGYVATHERGACWNRTKAGVIAYTEARQ